jgi:tRNA-binding EMAP/Myf-like protein
MERKLATIRSIGQISPILGADKIELATVDGWNVVVGKDVGHKVGDLVIYCEIDSFLPIREEFEFLRKSSYKKMVGKEGFRLKTIKLRGQISQGLILPISVLNPPNTNIYVTPFEGLDVTEILGIIKYEPPIPANLVGKVKGIFPSFIPKTDEERCLSEDTIIITENGPITIKEICETKYSGKVLSYNPISNEDEMNFINSHSIQKNNSDWYEIELESGKIIRTTGNHRIWLPELRCFREVKELLGDEIVKVIKKTDI